MAGRKSARKIATAAMSDNEKVTTIKAKVTGDLSELVEKYIKLRDKREAVAEAVKEKQAKIDAVLERIEGILLATMEDMGMESVATSNGTAYKSTRSSATVADWDAAFDYIRTHEAWHMLERRVNKKSIVAHKEETGELPPGVNWREEVTVNIRRKS